MEATRSGEGPFDVQAQAQAEAQKPNRYRGWNIRRRRRGVLARHHHIPAHHASSEVRGQNPIPTVAPLIYVMKYMVPLVLVFVTTLRYGGKPQRQLLESPAWMWCFIAATCAYWLIVGEIKQMATTTRGTAIRFRIYRGAALASGILSAVLIISMLLIRPASIWLPLAVIIIAALILYAAYSLLYSGIKCVVPVVAWARGLSSTKESSALPV